MATFLASILASVFGLHPGPAPGQPRDPAPVNSPGSTAPSTSTDNRKSPLYLRSDQ